MASTASPLRAPLTFRPVRRDDEVFLRTLYASTRESELAPLPWTQAQKEAFLDVQFRAQHTYYQSMFAGASFQIILLQEQPIGRLYLHRRRDELRIIDIALLPEFRGQGLGTKMMRDILAEGRKSKKPVRIHVESFNPALRLYKRLGFKKIEDKGVYILMEWRPE